ncbi:MAG: hypothetical protein BWK77_07760 [Verrucomicrobia bacterium A1]|nr:MAG: hypothetical protein BWK77_07760 [Verrucomicrobia bacterium A1]
MARVLGLLALSLSFVAAAQAAPEKPVRVLMTTDHPKNSPHLVWVREQGPARIAYIQFGHDAKAYANPAYRTVVRQAILWAAKRDVASP